jgi:hypothetical protein
MRRIRTYPLIVAGAASLAAAATTAALAAGSRVPAKDSFGGSIASASGAFKKDQGHLWIAVSAGQSSTNDRPVTLTLKGRRCRRAVRCVKLIGTLAGTLTGMASIPDGGRSFLLSATGRVKPLGRVSATGQVHGTGFILRGHETMTLRLSNSHGAVQVQAESPAVPGFTSP